MAKLEFHLQEAVDVIKKQKIDQIQDIDLKNEKIRLKSTFGEYIISFDKLEDNHLTFNVMADSILAHMTNFAKDFDIFKNQFPDFLQYKNNKIYIDLDKTAIPFNVESVIQKNQNIIIEGKIL